MTVHALSGPPPPELARALAAFEAQFTYPLGPGRHFRISHGNDYARFFRAMGEAVCFVAERSGQVHGVVALALRRLLLPDGREQTVAYVGDLKVAPEVHRGTVFLRLAEAALDWLRPRTMTGFGVVMDGTRATPDRYTGRFGIPPVRVLGKVVVWRFRCPAEAGDDEQFAAKADQVRECFRWLSRGRYAAAAGQPVERSEMEPVGLCHPDGLACGLVEDTRRAKRLLADDGTELCSGHLSFFAWATPRAGAELIRVALRHAGRAGHPALFVAVAEPDAAELEKALGPAEKVTAPATVYGHGLDPGPAWNINTSEI